MELTARQIEVCVLAGCSGIWMSNKAIARELGITVHTVDTHLRDAARRIAEAMPAIHAAPPRHLCHAWLRAAYREAITRPAGFSGSFPADRPRGTADPGY